jgi:hypothetical protein
VSDPTPADVLRRAQPVPTYRDHPATTPHDVVGVDPFGAPRAIAIVGVTEPVLLLFLAAACLGCADLWAGLDQVRAGLPDRVRLAVVTQGPESEDPRLIADLGTSGTETVMSAQAFADYRVTGPPFLVVADGLEVRTEGVAWGIEETLRATRAALEGGGGGGRR